jgi:hypothetical protein
MYFFVVKTKGRTLKESDAVFKAEILRTASAAEVLVGGTTMVNEEGHERSDLVRV